MLPTDTLSVTYEYQKLIYHYQMITHRKYRQTLKSLPFLERFVFALLVI